jgi:hypothetical protein
MMARCRMRENEECCGRFLEKKAIKIVQENLP